MRTRSEIVAEALRGTPALRRPRLPGEAPPTAYGTPDGAGALLAALGNDDPITRLHEKVKQAIAAGRVSFLPWLDPYTEETPQMVRMYPVMLRNGVVRQSLQHKVASVAALDVQIIPAGDSPLDQTVADFVRYAYCDAIEGEFLALAEEILMPALMIKSAVSEKVWYPDLWDRGRWRGKRFYRCFKSKEFVQPLQDEYKNLIGVKAQAFGQDEVYPAEDFVYLRNWPLFGGPGTSDLRAAYLPLWQLDTIEKLHLIHLERYLSPIMAATYDSAFAVAELPKLQADLAAVRSRGWVTVPEHVKIAALQMATRGEAEYLEKCKDLREQIALAITGAYLQMLTSQATTDIRGNSETHRSTAELLVWELAGRLASALNTQATPQLVQTNFAGADYPKLTLGGINYAELQAAIAIDTAAQKMGVPLSLKGIGRKYSIPIATDPADTLTPPAAASPFGGGGGFDGGGGGMAFADPSAPPDPEAPEGRQLFCGGPGSGRPGPCPSGAGDVDRDAMKAKAATGAVPFPIEKRPYKYNFSAFHDAQHNSNIPVTMLDPANLVATQDFTVPFKRESMKGNLRPDRPILVIRHGGKDYIEEGHHRSIHALVTGQAVPAKILEQVAPGKYRPVGAAAGHADNPGAPPHVGRQLFCGGPGSGKPGPCPQGAGKSKAAGKGRGRGRAPAAASAPAAAGATNPDPMHGHPFAGQSREQMVAELTRQADPQTASPNPRGYDTTRYPAGVDGPAFTAAVTSFVGRQQAANPFARPTLPQVYDAARAAQPGLTLAAFQAAIVKAAADGQLDLGAFTQATSEIPDPAHAIPIHRQKMYYVGLPAGGQRRNAEEFADSPTALAGPDGQQAERLLRKAQAAGAAAIGTLTRRAVGRLLADGDPAKALGAGRLFTSGERKLLGQALASALAPAELLGRARIVRRAEQAARRHAEAGPNRKAERFSDQPTDLRCFDETGPLAPMRPEAAAEYFRKLVPGLAVDAAALGASTLRRAFRLAVSTDETLLGKIKGLIQERLDTGRDVRGAADEVQELLDLAGVSPANPQYAEAVVRTNLMSAYNEGATAELAEHTDIFPAWTYLNPDDARSRPEHAARNGKLYPSSAAFSDVRGTEAGDVINCRCAFAAVDRWELEKREAAGQSVETSW